MTETMRVIAMLDLQLFADSGDVVTTTAGYVNAYTGATVPASPSTNTMAPTMKTYYDTELLENARTKLIYTQLGKKQALPKNHGKTVEWRKFNTFAPATTPLAEGVIPTGKQFGMTSINVGVNQYGDYVTISDQLEMHAVDPIILGATEEMGAAGGETADILCRNVLVAGTNVIYAPNGSTEVKSRANLTAACVLTPDVINKAVTMLKKQKAPAFEGGKYVAVIHPSVSYDLRSSQEWIEAHKYAATTEIFNGEIGELHGMRFIETTNAPILQAASGVVCYATICFGKDAFGVVDPAGMGMQMIIKDKGEAGGPLEQFSTVGYKFEAATKILYQERMVRIESGSAYSGVDTVN